MKLFNKRKYPCSISDCSFKEGKGRTMNKKKEKNQVKISEENKKKDEKTKILFSTIVTKRASVGGSPLKSIKTTISLTLLITLDNNY